MLSLNLSANDQASGRFLNRLSAILLTSASLSMTGLQPAQAQFLAPPDTQRAPFQYTGLLRGQLPGIAIAIRSKPNPHARPVAEGYIGQIIPVVGQTRQGQDLWFRVETPDGQQGWIHQEFLRPAALTNLDNFDTAAFDFLKQTGVVDLSNALDYGWQSAAKINVRMDPNPRSEVLYSVEGGDRLHILGQTEGPDRFIWYYVSLDSLARGWVRGDVIRLVN